MTFLLLEGVELAGQLLQFPLGLLPNEGLVLPALEFLGEGFNFDFNYIFALDVELGNVLQLLQDFLLPGFPIGVGVLEGAHVASSGLGGGYLYLLMDEGEQAEQTALAHTLQ